MSKESIITSGPESEVFAEDQSLSKVHVILCDAYKENDSDDEKITTFSGESQNDLSLSKVHVILGDAYYEGNNSDEKITASSGESQNDLSLSEVHQILGDRYYEGNDSNDANTQASLDEDIFGEDTGNISDYFEFIDCMGAMGFSLESL